MDIKIFFDFHDIFVDAKNAWIKAFTIMSWDSKIIWDYCNGISKKEISKKYGLSYKSVEILYRRLLKKKTINLRFAKSLSHIHPINILSMSRKDRLLKDMNKFKMTKIFQDIISKEDIVSKEDFLKKESGKHNWILYFNHELQSIQIDWNIIYLPIKL